MADVDAVNTVLGEQQAGQNDNGAIDMIWINGENFKTAKQADLLLCDWAKALPNRLRREVEEAVQRFHGTRISLGGSSR